MKEKEQMEYSEELYTKLLEILNTIANIGMKEPINEYDRGFVQVLRKLFFNAISAHHLRDGSKVPFNVPNYDDPRVIDFTAVASLERSISEAYLNLYEVYIEPKDIDHQLYTHNVYCLSGQLRKMTVKKPRPQNVDGYKKAESKIEELRNIIKGTSYYKTLDRNQKKSTLEHGRLIYKDKRKYNNLLARWKATPLYTNDDNFNISYVFLSEFVHSGSLSAANLYHSASSEHDRQRCNTHLLAITRILLQVFVHCKQHPTLSAYLQYNDAVLRDLLLDLK